MLHWDEGRLLDMEFTERLLRDAGVTAGMRAIDVGCERVGAKAWLAGRGVCPDAPVAAQASRKRRPITPTTMVPPREQEVRGFGISCSGMESRSTFPQTSPQHVLHCRRRSRLDRHVPIALRGLVMPAAPVEIGKHSRPKIRAHEPRRRIESI